MRTSVDMENDERKRRGKKEIKIKKNKKKQDETIVFDY